MRKWLGAAIGLLCACAAMGLCIALVRSLRPIAEALAPLIGEKTAGQIAAILGQLRTAQVMPPAAGALCAGALLGFGLLRGRGMVWKAIALSLLLTLPCIWFADVNGIRFAAAAQIVLNMLRAGML
ncbi:MAG: hypothetical protein IJB41_06975 [Clostridia bacterium]|nr:hypothetical protein [Clostridia bacterium]